MEETLLAASRERQRQVQDVTGHSECSLKHNKNIYVLFHWWHRKYYKWKY